ncbi:MAG: Uma2 family endonuclease [Anaerolineales bacterium]|nr:Uma2 family endonuclease [Anaerolineales bacterium]
MTQPTIIAHAIPAEVFLTEYADSFHEWVEGVVIQMSPASRHHQQLVNYLRTLLNAYLSLNPLGEVYDAPFVMRLENSFREPDLQVIFKDNPGTLTETAMLGAADICVEVVSPESVARDYGDKFAEYEQGGVREYWLIDPLRQEANFYRLQANGLYSRVVPDANEAYRTPLLPRLRVLVAGLWQQPLPDLLTVTEQVKAMFAEGE